MSNPAVSTPALADEIRKSERVFVEAAVSALRNAFKTEYCRLRGYAFEAGTTEIVLNVQIRCGFSANSQFVEIRSNPVFTPPVREVRVPIGQRGN